jgi:hypothetical protein
MDLLIYPINAIIEFVPERVDPQQRCTLKCKDKECPWLLYGPRPLYASSTAETDLWQIRTFGSNSFGINHVGINHIGHCNIDEEFISTDILPQVRSNPSNKPKNIQEYFKDHYGVIHESLHRAKECALKLMNGSHEEAHSRLPKYCEEIQRSNTGSTGQLDVDPNDETVSTCIHLLCCKCYGLCLFRPLLGLDGTHLKRKVHFVFYDH